MTPSSLVVDAVHVTVQRLIGCLGSSGRSQEGPRKLLLSPPAPPQTCLPRLPALAARGNLYFCIYRDHPLHPEYASTSRNSQVSLTQPAVHPALSYLGLKMRKDSTKGEVLQAPTTDEMLRSTSTSPEQAWGWPSVLQRAGMQISKGF